MLESRIISLSCPPADETDNGHKDDDHGMLKNLFPPFIKSLLVVGPIAFHFKCKCKCECKCKC